MQSKYSFFPFVVFCFYHHFKGWRFRWENDVERKKVPFHYEFCVSLNVFIYLFCWFPSRPLLSAFRFIVRVSTIVSDHSPNKAGLECVLPECRTLRVQLQCDLAWENWAGPHMVWGFNFTPSSSDRLTDWLPRSHCQISSSVTTLRQGQADRVRKNI